MSSDGPHETKRRRPLLSWESVTFQSLSQETGRDPITVNASINAISFLQPHVNNACH